MSNISNIMFSKLTPEEISNLAKRVADIYKEQTKTKEYPGISNFLGDVKKELIPVLPIIIVELETMGFKFEAKV